MFPTLSFVSTFIEWGTVFAQFFFIFLLILFFVERKKEVSHPFFLFIQHNALWMSFVVVGAGILGSLFYSEILGFPPCLLCVIQRVLLYPQFFLFFIASFRARVTMIRIALALSILGAFVALYNTLLQMGIGASFCDVVSNGISCAQRFVFAFGYLTIPLMGLTAFLLIIILCLFTLRDVRVVRVI